MTKNNSNQHSISLAEASELTERFRNNNTNNNAIAECFDGDAIRDILNQEGCVDIRIYFGLNTYDKLCLVITGVDISGNDLYDGLLAERGIRCPVYCSSTNPLNQNSIM